MPTKSSNRAAAKRKAEGRGPSVENKQAGRGAGDELEEFERRKEWFYGMRAGQSGFTFLNKRVLALRQAAMPKAARLAESAPSGPPPKRGLELVGDGTGKARLRKANNPRPNSSLGFAAQVVEVRASGALQGSVLKIALDKQLTDAIDPATVRVFHFNEAVAEWHIVARSGVSAKGDFAWARLHRPGLYVPIGLPRNYWLMRAVMLLHLYAPWLRATQQTKTPERQLERLCKLLFTADLPDTARAGGLTLPPAPDRAELKRIYERCLKLDLSRNGLPEGEILDDAEDARNVAAKISLPVFRRRWASLGPTNFSGRIKCLAIDPSTPENVHAGGAEGGVWETQDGGESWYARMSDEASLAIGALAISASDPNTVYAGTGEDVPGWGPAYAGVGVLKTTDSGNNWALLSPIRSNRCSRVLVHPTDANIVYVAGNGGLHKSVDGGQSWLNLFTEHVSDALMDPLAPDTLYAAVWDQGVFRSLDGGSNWTQLANGIPTGDDAGWIKLAMGLKGSGGTKFLVTKMGPDSTKMYKTSNGGDSWTALPGERDKVAYNEWTNLVAVDPSNHDVIFAGGSNLERSTDGGKTFTAIDGTHSDHHVLVFNPDDSNICYVSTDGGVYKSVDNGVTWALKSQSLVCTQLFSIGVAQTTPFLFGSATQDQGIILCDGSSTDWVRPAGSGNEGGFFIVDPNDSHNIYDSPGSNLQRSTDAGVTWTSILNGLNLVARALTQSGSSYLDVTNAINDDNGETVKIPGGALNNALYVGGDRPFTKFAYTISQRGVSGKMAVEYYDDELEDWAALTVTEGASGAKNFTVSSGTVLSWEPPDHWAAHNVNGLGYFWIRFRVTTAYTTSPVLIKATIEPPASVKHLAVKPGDSALLLCVADHHVFRSDDQGNNWSRSLHTDNKPWRVAFSPSQPTRCYVATDGGHVYGNDNSGEFGTWYEPYLPADKPPSGFISSIVVDWADPNVVYITYSDYAPQVHKSVDGGKTWQSISGDAANLLLPDITVSALVVDQYNPDVLYVATDIGVFRTRDGGSTWAEIEANMPNIIVTELALHKSDNTLYVSTMGRGAYKRLL